MAEDYTVTEAESIGAKKQPKASKTKSPGTPLASGPALAEFDDGGFSASESEFSTGFDPEDELEAFDAPSGAMTLEEAQALVRGPTMDLDSLTLEDADRLSAFEGMLSEEARDSIQLGKRKSEAVAAGVLDQKHSIFRLALPKDYHAELDRRSLLGEMGAAEATGRWWDQLTSLEDALPDWYRALVPSDTTKFDARGGLLFLRNVQESMERLERDDYGEAAVPGLVKSLYGEVDLKAFDQLMVHRFFFMLAEREERGETLPGAIAEAVTESAEWAALFGLGGAVRKGAVKMTENAAAKALRAGVERSLLQRVAIGTAGGAAGTVSMTPFLLPKTIENYAGRRIDGSFQFTDKGLELIANTENPWVTAFKSQSEVWISALAELSGGGITLAGKSAAGVLGKVLPDKAVRGLEALYKRLHPGETLQKLWTATGFHGFIAELGEEQLEAFLMALTGLRDDPNNPTPMATRLMDSVLWGRELQVTTGAIVVQGLGLRAGASVYDQLTRMREVRAESGKISEADEIDSQLNEITPEVLDTIVPPAEEPDMGPTATPGERASAEPDLGPAVQQEPVPEPPETLPEGLRAEVEATEKDTRLASEKLTTNARIREIERVYAATEKEQAEAHKAFAEVASELEALEQTPENADRYATLAAKQQALTTRIDKLDTKLFNLDREVSGIEGLDPAKAGAIRTNVQSVLAATKRDMKRAAKEGRDITKETQDRLIGIINENLPKKDRGDFLVAVKNANTPEKLERQLPKIRARIYRTQERNERKKLVSDVETAIGKTAVASGEPGRLTPEAQDDMDTLRLALKIRDPIALAEAVKDARTPREAALLSAGAMLKDKSTKELKDLTRLIDSILAKAKKRREEFDRKRQKRGRRLVRQALGATSKAEPGRIRRFLTDVGNQILRPSRAWSDIKRIVFPDAPTTLKNALNVHANIQRAEALNQQDQATVVSLAQEHFADEIGQIKGPKSHKLFTFLAKRSFKQYEVEPGVNLTINEAGYIYLVLKDSTASLGLETEGVILSNGKKVAVTPELAAKIVALLTPKDRAFFDALQAWGVSLHSRLNAQFRKDYRRNLTRLEDYSGPVKRQDQDPDVGPLQLLEIDWQNRGVAPSSVKSRELSKAPIILRDAVANYLSYAQAVNHYHHLSDKVRDIDTVFTDPDVRSAITLAHGPAMLAHIDAQRKSLRDRNIRVKQSLEGLATVVRRLRSFAFLSFKLATGTKQIASLPAFFAEGMPPGAVTRSMTKLATDKDFLVRSVKEIINSQFFQTRKHTLDPDVQAAADLFLSHPTISNAAFIFIHLFDRVAVLGGGIIRYTHTHQGAYASALASGSTPAQADKVARKAAVADFERVAGDTQQTSNLEFAPRVVQENAYVRLALGEFITSANALARQELRIVSNWRSGKISNTEAAWGLFLHHAVMPNILMAIATGFGAFSDDDDIKDKALTYHLIGTLTGSFGGLVALGGLLDNAVGRVVNWLEDDPSHRKRIYPINEKLTEAVDESLREMFKPSDDPWEFWDFFDWMLKSNPLAPRQAPKMVKTLRDDFDRNKDGWVELFLDAMGAPQSWYDTMGIED